MKRKREKEEENKHEKGMEIVWQTPANPPEKVDYIFRDGKFYEIEIILVQLAVDSFVIIVILNV